MSDDLVTWLREQITEDRKRWVTCEALGEQGCREDLIARCEAELAILDEHKHEPADEHRYPDGGFGCHICAYNDDYGIIQALGWCRTVRLLASGYQYRPGYQEGWRP